MKRALPRRTGVRFTTGPGGRTCAPGTARVGVRAAPGPQAIACATSCRRPSRARARMIPPPPEPASLAPRAPPSRAPSTRRSISTLDTPIFSSSTWLRVVKGPSCAPVPEAQGLRSPGGEGPMAPKRGIRAPGRSSSQARRREFISLVRATVPMPPITRGRAGWSGTGYPSRAATAKRITPP